MSNLQEKAKKFSEKYSNGKHFRDLEFGYENGFSDCQKEYEEKLRWIPIEEKLPEPNSEVLAKDINGDIEKVLFHATQFSIMHNLGFITHWRSFL